MLRIQSNNSAQFDLLREELLDIIQSEIKKIKKERPITELLEKIKQLKGKEGEQGEKGDRGEQGLRGFQGERGVQGLSGKNGIDGFNGKNGKDGKDGKNGLDGKEGIRGERGEIGNAPAHKWEDFTLYFQQPNGDWGKGMDFGTLIDRHINRLSGELRNLKLGGKGGGGGSIFETPTGTIDSSNKTFTVTKVPKYIVIDGLQYFVDNGYTISGLTITTTVAPTGFIRSAKE